MVHSQDQGMWGKSQDVFGASLFQKHYHFGIIYWALSLPILAMHFSMKPVLSKILFAGFVASNLWGVALQSEIYESSGNLRNARLLRDLDNIIEEDATIICNFPLKVAYTLERDYADIRWYKQNAHLITNPVYLFRGEWAPERVMDHLKGSDLKLTPTSSPGLFRLSRQ